MTHIVVPRSAPVAEFPGRWALYQLPTPAAESASFLWPTFKLLTTSAPRRWGSSRVFRLGWSPVAARFRRDRQSQLLAEQEPELARRVGLWLELERDRSWLEQFFTADEIEVERRRISS